MRAEGLRVWLPVSGKRFVRAVDGITFAIDRGEIVGLVGESGSGKSTLGRAFVRLLRPTSGRVFFDGLDVSALSQSRLRPLRRRLQMIFQHPAPALNPRIRVGRSIAEPLDAAHVPQRDARDRVHAMLERVGLPASAALQFPHELSGGQLQRVAIARALVARPDFVVADEPLSSLDLSVQAQVVVLLKELQAELHVGLLFITHDLAIAEYLSDRIVVMYLGKVMEIAPGPQFSRNARHPYSRALLDAVPRLDPQAERERNSAGLSGEVPSALDPPKGCRFHTRCALVQDRCLIEEPPLRKISVTHEAACWFV